MRNLRTYAQLVRLPNVFTAFADVLLGALVTGALTARPAAVGLLLLASACLYCGGMVWNDYFDLEQEKRERPFRPLPSGRVTPARAALLGAALLTAGVALAVLADLTRDSFCGCATVVAGLLVGAILLYDGWLKRTWAGPVGMGLCRFLNVLLGLSALPGGGLGLSLTLALVVGVYIAGVTWFARTEARESSQHALAAAAAVMLAGLLLALVLPALAGAGTTDDVESPALWWGHFLFPYLLVGFGFLVGVPVCRAVAWPVPARVQAAVKRSVLGLVLLDAVLATALAGVAGLLLALLLPPALYLGRWLYST